MKKMIQLLPVVIALLAGCVSNEKTSIDIIFDTDANNELDDQHAIAYLLLNDDVFNTIGITTNVTINGGIDAQCEEVTRVAALLGHFGDGVRILPGATAKFEDILPSLDSAAYDGSAAVEFMIEAAKRYSPENKLTVVPVGKLTNIALALFKAPEIIPNLRVVWLGSNYPGGGEHNLICDIPSMNYVIESGVQFEMLVCRYGEPTGTSAVRVSIDRVRSEFAGKGPEAATPVTGRNGGEFTCFGDYSVDLFEHIHLNEDGTRSLFDLVTLAVVKNPEWGKATVIPAPIFDGTNWVERPDNQHYITIWTDFAREEIISDFISSLDKR